MKARTMSSEHTSLMGTNYAGCDKGLSLGTDPSSRAKSVL
jgi:hypothetical protein